MNLRQCSDDPQRLRVARRHEVERDARRRAVAGRRRQLADGQLFRLRRLIASAGLGSPGSSSSASSPASSPASSMAAAAAAAAAASSGGPSTRPSSASSSPSAEEPALLSVLAWLTTLAGDSHSISPFARAQLARARSGMAWTGERGAPPPRPIRRPRDHHVEQVHEPPAAAAAGTSARATLCRFDLPRNLIEIVLRPDSIEPSTPDARVHRARRRGWLRSHAALLRLGGLDRVGPRRRALAAVIGRLRDGLVDLAARGRRLGRGFGGRHWAARVARRRRKRVRYSGGYGVIITINKQKKNKRRRVQYWVL